MKLADLVEASSRAAATTSRLGKRDAIAACLRAAAPEEIAIAVAFLSGETLQSKLGVGYASVSTLRGEAGAAEPTLTLAEVDAALAALSPSRRLSRSIGAHMAHVRYFSRLHRESLQVRSVSSPSKLSSEAVSATSTS